MRQYLDNKYLMTGPTGNSEFCFPETLTISQGEGEAKGNIEVEAFKDKNIFLDADWHTHLPRF